MAAQLPMLVRGLFYEGWRPTGKRSRGRAKEAFLGQIADALVDTPDLYPEGVAWGVLRVLDRHVSEGEIGDVKSILPAEILALWPRGGGRQGP